MTTSHERLQHIVQYVSDKFNFVKWEEIFYWRRRNARICLYLIMKANGMKELYPCFTHNLDQFIHKKLVPEYVLDWAREYKPK